MSHTIDQGVKTAPGKVGGLGHGIHVGNLLATRKNPPVTSAGLRLNYQPNYWCFTLMGISIMPSYAISKQFVSTVLNYLKKPTLLGVVGILNQIFNLLV